MAFCMNCGTKMKDGAVFCHECGTRAMPIEDVVQDEKLKALQTPSRLQKPAGKLSFEILQREFVKMLSVTLEHSAFRYEAGAMHYMKGALTIESNLPSGSKFLKSMVTRESAVKPVISGTGTVVMEPTFGELTILDLQGEEWILDRGAYYASEMGIEIGVFSNKALQGLFSGEGFFQTRVSGTGKVVVYSAGPLEEVVLHNEQLVVDGAFTVARTAGIEMQVSKATKGFFSSFTSGEGIVNTFSGEGRVLIAPVPNRYVSLMNYLSSIHSNTLAARK